jgi:8-oxo-dGTP diphosphatase
MTDTLPKETTRSAVAVDLVIFTVRAHPLGSLPASLCVLLIRRANPPFKGKWALPGGFVRGRETLDEAAERELHEETGMRGHVEQLRTYGDVKRDPRGRVFSVAYLALAPDFGALTSGGDAEAAAWHSVDVVPALAFDHAHILRDGLERARAKLEYTTLATTFCDMQFTIPELRAVYEAVWGQTLDAANFYRKVTRSEGFIAPLKDTQQGAEGRPARLYRPGTATLLMPPMMRR